MFQVNLNIEVDPRDKPSTKPPPWDGFQTKGLNPKILFSTRDEQQEILSKFGEQRLSLENQLPCRIVISLTRTLRRQTRAAASARFLCVLRLGVVPAASRKLQCG